MNHMRSNSHLPVLRLLLIPFIVYHSPSDGVEQPLSSHSGSTQDLGLWAVLLCYVLLLCTPKNVCTPTTMGMTKGIGVLPAVLFFCKTWSCTDFQATVCRGQGRIPDAHVFAS